MRRERRRLRQRQREGRALRRGAGGGTWQQKSGKRQHECMEIDSLVASRGVEIRSLVLARNIVERRNVRWMTVLSTYRKSETMSTET